MGLDILAEGQFIFGPDDAVRESLDLFDRNVLLGYRLDLQDESSTVFMATAISDVERPRELLVTLAFEPTPERSIHHEYRPTYFSSPGRRGQSLAVYPMA